MYPIIAFGGFSPFLCLTIIEAFVEYGRISQLPYLECIRSRGFPIEGWAGPKQWLVTIPTPTELKKEASDKTGLHLQMLMPLHEAVLGSDPYHP